MTALGLDPPGVLRLNSVLERGRGGRVLKVASEVIGLEEEDRAGERDLGVTEATYM